MASFKDLPGCAKFGAIQGNAKFPAGLGNALFDARPAKAKFKGSIRPIQHRRKTVKNKFPSRSSGKSKAGSNHVVRGNQGPETPTGGNKMPGKKSGMASGGSNHVQNLPAHQK